LNDWSLGSVDEMAALYSYPDRAAIGGFNSGAYWTSTPTPTVFNNSYLYALTEVFDVTMVGHSQLKQQIYSFGVRPLRAF